VGRRLGRRLSSGGTTRRTRPKRNRSLKLHHVENATVRQILVYDGDECVERCQ
jgi:hypothetical protein